MVAMKNIFFLLWSIIHQDFSNTNVHTTEYILRNILLFLRRISWSDRVSDCRISFGAKQDNIYKYMCTYINR